jgi:hypothetical protein
MSVLALAASATDDIRDIRGPIAPPEWSPWLLYVGLLLALCACAWLARRALRTRRRQPLTPYARARQQLMAADPRQSPSPPDVFAERVSLAVREYVEARFELPATHRTSEEFLADLLVSEALAPQRPLLSGFLQACDLAKFAGRTLQREAMNELHAAALHFIEAVETAPTGERA